MLDAYVAQGISNNNFHWLFFYMAKFLRSRISDPQKIVPVTSKIDGISKKFTRIFDPYSVSVL